MSALVKHLMHVCITVPNLDQALNFYRDVLGFESVFETRNDKADGRLLGFDTDEVSISAHHVLTVGADAQTATAINLVEHTQPETVVNGGPYDQMNHVGITRLALLVDNVDEAFARIRSHEGVTIVCPPRGICIQDPKVPVTSRWFSFTDPFGVFVTMTEPLPDQC
ncbi:VOC family protein [Streptomyces sp. NPDC056296]|uniref:VOC family protein n=1 Tax=Streptomyces sp. NPDC056296 TaxID=3345775 RepID=UPI0035DE6857